MDSNSTRSDAERSCLRLPAINIAHIQSEVQQKERINEKSKSLQARRALVQWCFSCFCSENDELFPSKDDCRLFVAAASIAALASCGKVMSVPMRVAPLSHAQAVAFSTKKVQCPGRVAVERRHRENERVCADEWQHLSNGRVLRRDANRHATANVQCRARHWLGHVDFACSWLQWLRSKCAEIQSKVVHYDRQGRCQLCASDCDNYFDPFASQCAFSNSYTTCVNSDPTEVCTESGPVWLDTFSVGGLSAQGDARQHHEADAVVTRSKTRLTASWVSAGHTSFGKPIPI
jgi:hypothetical protein